MGINPFFSGANVPHPLTMDLPSEEQLHRRAAETYRCALCGHVERHPVPAELRFKACVHAREHEVLA
jgi:hypothetical protein